MRENKNFSEAARQVVDRRQSLGEFFRDHSDYFERRGAYVAKKWGGNSHGYTQEDLAQEARLAALERVVPNIPAMVAEVGESDGDFGLVSCPACDLDLVEIDLDSDSDSYGEWSCGRCGRSGDDRDIAMSHYRIDDDGVVVPIRECDKGRPLLDEELWKIPHYKYTYNPHRLTKAGVPTRPQDYLNYYMGDAPTKAVRRSMQYRTGGNVYHFCPDEPLTLVNTTDTYYRSGSLAAKLYQESQEPGWSNLPADFSQLAESAILEIPGVTGKDKLAACRVIQLVAGLDDDGALDIDRAVIVAALEYDVSPVALRHIIGSMTGENHDRRKDRPMIYDPLALPPDDAALSDGQALILSESHDDEVEEIRHAETSADAIQVVRRCYARAANSQYDLAHILYVSRESEVWKRDDTYSNFQEFVELGLKLDRGKDAVRKMIGAYEVVSSIAEEYECDPRELWQRGYFRLYALKSVTDGDVRRQLVTALLGGATYSEIMDQKAELESIETTATEVEPEPTPTVIEDSPPEPTIQELEKSTLRIYVTVPEDTNIPIPPRDLTDPDPTRNMRKGCPLSELPQTYCEYTIDANHSFQFTFDVRDNRFLGVNLVARKRR